MGSTFEEKEKSFTSKTVQSEAVSEQNLAYHQVADIINSTKLREFIAKHIQCAKLGIGTEKDFNEITIAIAGLLDNLRPGCCV